MYPKYPSSHRAGLEDVAFMGLASVVIAVAVVTLGYGLATFVETPDIQNAITALSQSIDWARGICEGCEQNLAAH
jgi:hypothetical protein